MTIETRQGGDHAAELALQPVMIYAWLGTHEHWRDPSKAGLNRQAKRGAKPHHRPYVFSNDGCDI
jgi:hypothetical protein